MKPYLRPTSMSALAQQTCWNLGMTFGSGSDLFPRPSAEALQVARTFLESPSWGDADWSEAERRAIEPFFSSATSRVFFGTGLPANVFAALAAQYSRMTPKRRGVRDVWANTFLPELLVSMLPEEMLAPYAGEVNPEVAYIEKLGTNGIEDFLAAHSEHQAAFEQLLRGVQDRKLMQRIASSKRTKNFLKRNLDKYGHDSIARMAAALFFLEGVSQHIASAIEWARVGIGIIELSTRYVNMKGAGRYPIAEELRSLVGDVLANKVIAYLDLCQEAYATMNGSLAELLKTHWAELIPDENQMKVGVNGEVPDVLGNFIPYCSLTSMAVAVSCEELQQVLKHLRNDGTAEAFSVADMIQEQAEMVGVGQFLRYTEPTLWERTGWTYPQAHGGVVSALRVGSSDLLRAELKRNGLSLDELREWKFAGGNQETSSREGQEGLKTENMRGSHDKLPSVFEVLDVHFTYEISFRGHRDVKRHVVGRQDRTLLTPYLGFYAYDKFDCPLYTEMAQKVCDEGYALYEELLQAGVPAGVLQYVLPLGFVVAASYKLNARQAEFFCWRRSGSDVNHEVRQVALALDAALDRELAWWRGLSRTNLVSGYVFARTPEKVPHMALPA